MVKFPQERLSGLTLFGMVCLAATKLVIHSLPIINERQSATISKTHLVKNAAKTLCSVGTATLRNEPLAAPFNALQNRANFFIRIS
ncbi:MAG: hypothetical protein ACYC0Z_09915, partial [Acidobacteriaceae bacterium]